MLCYDLLWFYVTKILHILKLWSTYLDGCKTVLQNVIFQDENITSKWQNSEHFHFISIIDFSNTFYENYSRTLQYLMLTMYCIYLLPKRIRKWANSRTLLVITSFSEFGKDWNYLLRGILVSSGMWPQNLPMYSKFHSWLLKLLPHSVFPTLDSGWGTNFANGGKYIFLKAAGWILQFTSISVISLDHPTPRLGSFERGMENFSFRYGGGESRPQCTLWTLL